MKMSLNLLEELKKPIDPLDELIEGWNLKEIKDTFKKFEGNLIKQLRYYRKRERILMDRIEEIKKPKGKRDK